MSGELDQYWSRQIALEYGVEPPRVVLADGDDERIRSACIQLLDAGVTPVLLGESRGRLPAEVGYLSAQDAPPEQVHKTLVDVAERRDWDEARFEACVHDPLYLAAAMVSSGEADAAVGGASRPSGEVIRSALHVIGLSESTPILSSSFIMALADGRSVAFADCAVVPVPDSAQLADIAVATSQTFQTLVGQTPAVAMLSFSTHGSASHDDVERVRQATEFVRQRHPALDVDGELQFDAAFVESVGAQKCPESRVAGRANVFVFPNLAAGNIGYKIAQRMGGAQAYGPILQGLTAPMNDLSRGCSTADVVSVSLISALQAA